MNAVLIPAGMVTTLTECPPGLFIFKIESDVPCIGFKNEYGADNPHDMEVFVVESGECFWGGTDSKSERGDLRVVPAVIQFDEVK